MSSKKAALRVLQLVLLIGFAAAPVHSLALNFGLAVDVQFNATTSIYDYTYTLTENGPRQGQILQLVLPVNTTVPFAQPSYLPLSWDIPADWSISTYAPFNHGPEHPEMVRNGGWYFITPTPNDTAGLTVWTLSFETHYAPHLAEYEVRSYSAHPYYIEMGEILMPAYDGSFEETPYDAGTPVPETMPVSATIGILFLFFATIRRKFGQQENLR